MAKRVCSACFLVIGILVGLLLPGGSPRAQTVHTLPPVPLSLGARCGFLTECSRFDSIGLHLGSSTALRTDSSRSYLDLQELLRLSLTIGDLAELGASLAGRLSSDAEGGLRLSASPVSLYGRLRLLPLPLGSLAGAPLRLALTYQHDLVADSFGLSEPPGWSRGTLRLVAGRSLAPVDLEGSLGCVLAQPDAASPRPVAFELGASASLWLRRSADPAPHPELRLTAEALARFSLHPALPAEQRLLVGLLGQSASGYGGGLALGTQVLDGQAGFLAVARLQVSWGKRHHNPWAERKAAEPETTPEFIWKLLGAIDPVLGPDGCVYTDPTPQRPSTQWFCIGTPAPDDPAQIVLRDDKRLAVGTHLWEIGATLRLDDGRKVVAIPLHARFRKAVWDYLDANERDLAPNREKYRQQVCAGKVSILHGAQNDPGLASMIALDPMGASAALLGEELLRQLQCDPSPSLQDQALTTLSILGVARARGPLRARPPQAARFGEAGEGEAPAGKSGSGAPAGGVAEHAPPPLFQPSWSAKAREHLFSGNLDKYGEAKGWHYEPTGSAPKGTYVLEPTRSAPDAHGVYEANVMIEGVKKKARSTFFPAHWTPQEVETAIDQAYRSRKPAPRLGAFRGPSASGVEIEMNIDPQGQIQTAYPVYKSK